MSHAETYRVVGVRANGERVVISVNASREVADLVLKVIRNGMDFTDLHVELEKSDRE